MELAIRDRLVRRLERQDGQNRPEDLFAGHGHVGSDAVEDRRRHELAHAEIERLTAMRTVAPLLGAP